ncbi:MAG: hypothetical protein O2966_02845, partial [Proteobacteria bacterium]|nr:hypothetical protein [Pseudomonadota bacterium]
RAHCHRGSLVYLDFDTAYDIELMWDGQQHVFQGRTFCMTRRFSYDPKARIGIEVQTWEATGNDQANRGKEVHRLHPIYPYKFAEEAVNAGFRAINFVDPSTGEVETTPNKALRLGLFLRVQ